MTPEPFGPRLRRFRLKSGMTEAQLGEAAFPGMTNSDAMIRNIEDGTPIPLSWLVTIAAALDISTDELLGVESPVVRRLREALDAGGAGPLDNIDASAVGFLRSLLPESERG
ncbi:MAG TPA: helix-turn-helix transcriptional regulator [Gemmatimonadaceae bacterium]|nr:helix-turn-helix transcriptional regulator [Gemmatimonadaceae bacterium]